MLETMSKRMRNEAEFDAKLQGRELKYQGRAYMDTADFMRRHGFSRKVVKRPN